MQDVLFDQLSDIALINPMTTLPGWFALNSIDSNAHSLLYTDIPLHYVWHLLSLV